MDYEEFKKNIQLLTRINLSDYKERQMKRRIDTLMRRNGFKQYDEYIRSLRIDKDLYTEFVNLLTINVTEFFRNRERWDILSQEILPELLSSDRSIKVWSCACSTGEEACSVAMLLLSQLPPEYVHILATDIDQESLDSARQGVYNSISRDKLPAGVLGKHFDLDNNNNTVRKHVLDCITYQKLDLLRDRYPDNCDLILCRNVMIYFTDEAKDRIYRKLYDSLRVGGYLFVGNTEQIIASERYGFRSVHSFFYKKE